MSANNTLNPTRRGRGRLWARLAAVALCWLGWASAAWATPETVHFPSADGHTALVAYLFRPAGPGPHPAIVLLHGRAGAYSSLAHGVYTAETLSQRHRGWGEFWAERGYVALLVDSFGPRGYPAGFGRYSHQDRPPEVSEETARPLDAIGALRWLRTRPEVIPDRIGVQGWSNGGSTVLMTLGLLAEQGEAGGGFRAGLALYPGCGLQRYHDHYRVDVPLLVLLAEDDEEVSPAICRRLIERGRAAGGDIAEHLYPGATHDFDDPGRERQSVPANVAAAEDAHRRAVDFFAHQLR